MPQMPLCFWPSAILLRIILFISSISIAIYLLLACCTVRSYNRGWKYDAAVASWKRTWLRSLRCEKCRWKAWLRPPSAGPSPQPPPPVFCTVRPGVNTNDHYVCTVDFSVSTFKRKVVFLVPKYYEGKNKRRSVKVKCSKENVQVHFLWKIRQPCVCLICQHAVWKEGVWDAVRSRASTTVWDRGGRGPLGRDTNFLLAKHMLGVP